MKRATPVVEFESRLEADGSVRLPAACVRALRGERHVTVRVTGGVVPRALSSRGIGEDTIERIATMQLEEREAVIGFLRAEGMLASSKGFRRRSGRNHGKRI